MAWLCSAGSLTHSALRLDLQPYLPQDLDKRLAYLDHHPAPLLAHIADNPRPRLGIYFERLYHFLLSDILKWPILLENVQVRREGRTLGELDFVVYNRDEDRVEHHEIAVKFYLGVAGDDNPSTLWYGPNAQDRLDLKIKRLLTHQCRLTECPEARQLLESKGIEQPYPRLFMPGYLFYPQDGELSAPANTPDSHCCGEWCRAASLAEEHVSDWIFLQKPHWLGRYQSPTAPDPGQAAAALTAVQWGGPPRLFAQMAPHPSGEGWEEIRRVFVVPAHWPELSRSG
ncbi:DUF1853 family protein [Marinobacter nanhaiticus]|uniref:DUF1853 family protein n=1 Tax=Marinobacter nanhaiticus TaxID=1305740 RepID=UPI001D0D4D0A|nr:DUF1853 family protein [Marinobacter nanhaiticus]